MATFTRDELGTKVSTVVTGSPRLSGSLQSISLVAPSTRVCGSTGSVRQGESELSDGAIPSSCRLPSSTMISLNHDLPRSGTEATPEVELAAAVVVVAGGATWETAGVRRGVPVPDAPGDMPTPNAAAPAVATSRSPPAIHEVVLPGTAVMRPPLGTR